MTRKNVLIFPGGEYSASQIYFSLHNSLQYRPILGSSRSDHSEFISKDAITDLPFIYEEHFIEALNQVIQNESIDFIIPAHDTAAFSLMERQDEIMATVVCSPFKTAELCRYKSKTYEQLKSFPFVPKTYDIARGDAEFPLFAKNDVGSGSRDAFVISSAEQLEKLLDPKISYVLCEYLPGEEITVDCFTNSKRELLFAQPRTRSRIFNGISARSTTITMTEEIKRIAEVLSSEIEFRGYWFFQCKKDKDDQYKLLEISTRFAGTYGVSKNLDVNLPLLALCDFDGMDVDITPNKYEITADKNYIDRYKLNLQYERVYVGFDDTIVFNKEKYNTQMMQFLYQCLNENKEIVLITKHAPDIRETMKKHHLNEDLFAGIIEVPENSEKYVFMDNSKPSIFIDHSHSERKRVKEQLGIPTFDVSNVECLLDWS